MGDVSFTELAQELREHACGSITCGEPLARHTTFGVGGPADLFVVPRNEQGLKQILTTFHQHGIPWFAIGGGSNVLFSDRGYRGAVISLAGSGLTTFQIHNDKATFGAGVLLRSAIDATLDASRSGLEFCIGIPGTVGGAVVTNAHAFGFCVAEVIVQAAVLDRQGERVIYQQEKISSSLSTALDSHEVVLTHAVFQLKEDDPVAARRRSQEYVSKRRHTQPWDQPSAGCIFRNPAGEPAGKLIDRCGGKGMVVGRAMVSERHANFIVNTGNATSCDIYDLICMVRDLVRTKAGVELELEIDVVGEE